MKHDIGTKKSGRLAALLMLSAVLWSCGSGAADKAGVRHLSAEEAKAYLGKDDVLFLDVRLPIELRLQGTIRSALNIPSGDLPERLAEIPKDKSIVTFCSHGVRAADAAQLLASKGYRVAGAFALNDWKAKNYETVSPAD